MIEEGTWQLVLTSAGEAQVHTWYIHLLASYNTYHIHKYSTHTPQKTNKRKKNFSIVNKWLLDGWEEEEVEKGRMVLNELSTEAEFV